MCPYWTPNWAIVVCTRISSSSKYQRLYQNIENGGETAAARLWELLQHCFGL